MHSHSGEFCPGHAKDELESIVERALERGMTTLALTEHMPRMQDEDLYPEEVSLRLKWYPKLARKKLRNRQLAAADTIASLHSRHESYLARASSLRDKYAGRITLLVGFEGEYVRQAYGALIAELASDARVDFWLASLHHVYGIPIDFDADMYARALAIAGCEERLWERYFDEQHALLTLAAAGGRRRPRVVGHFDLLRLFSKEQGGLGWKGRRWIGVWARARRNLEYIAQQGMLLEVNTAGLRKGLGEPYPIREVCEVSADGESVSMCMADCS